MGHLFIGVMSGTSMDALDVAVVDLGVADSVRLVAKSRHAWPVSLRHQLVEVAGGKPISAQALAKLDVEIGLQIADAINLLLRKHQLEPQQIASIGCHGQTLAHDPDGTPPSTLQLGDGNVIAEATGITTINDFRRRDIAAGGQGAPLAAAFHAAFLRHPDRNRAVLNLGGIANLTLLPADRKTAVTGFDTGPANCLMDTWMHHKHGQTFDKDGAWAASGYADETLLRRLLDDHYFARRPPKSTGTQHFSVHWLNAALADTPGIGAADVQATLLELTAVSLTQALQREAPETEELWVCGGGAHNGALMRRLEQLASCPVQPTTHLGIDVDWVEVMTFAWLAQRTLSGEPGNLPEVTGSAGPRVLGCIHPA